MNACTTFLFALASSLSLTMAAEYNEFYIFGDSLSDAGNTPNAEPLNEGGRFTNGKVWNEYLAEMLDMPIPTKSSLYQEGDKPSKHATNFACGGAMTNKGMATFNVPSVWQQIRGRLGYLPIAFDRYGKDFEADDLVSIWAGANNLFFSGQTNIFNKFEEAGLRASKEQDLNIRQLISRKAKNLIIFNLPDIGKTPSVAKDAAAAGAATLFSQAFNKDFEVRVAQIAKEYPELRLVFVDVDAILNQLYKAPQEHGFSDYTTPLIDVHAKAAVEAKIKASAYVFYDDVHPTTDVHRLIAEQVYAQLKAGE